MEKNIINQLLRFKKYLQLTLPRIVVDRPFKDVLVAVGVTSLLFAFAYALPLFLEGNGQISDILFGGVLGLPVVMVGFAATSRTRPVPQPDPRQRFVRLVAAAGAGVALGLLNLGANYALASLDPRPTYRALWQAVSVGIHACDAGYRGSGDAPNIPMCSRLDRQLRHQRPAQAVHYRTLGVILHPLSLAYYTSTGLCRAFGPWTSST